MAAAAVKISVQTDWNGLLSSFDVSDNASMQTLWGKLNEVYPNLTNGPPLRLTYINKADGEVELQSPGDLAAALAQSKASQILELFISNASNGGTEETSTDGSTDGQRLKQARRRYGGTGPAAFWTFDTKWTLEDENVISKENKSEAAPSNKAMMNFECTLKQTGGGPVSVWENDSEPKPFNIFMTRWFGAVWPYIEFTDNSPFTLVSIRFKHEHNHNPGYASYPSYGVQMQLDQGDGDGFQNVGRPILVSPQTNGSVATIDLGGILVSPKNGTAILRWFPTGLNRGAKDTNTEYFGMRHVALRVAPVLQGEVAPQVAAAANGEGQANNSAAAAAAPGGPRTDIDREESRKEGQ